MKVTVKRTEIEAQVTFHLVYSADAVEFHDKVATKIAKSGPFIGRIFNLIYDLPLAQNMRPNEDVYNVEFKA